MEEYPERSTSFDRRLISLCDATEHLRAITWHFLQRLNLECHILEHMTITNSYIFETAANLMFTFANVAKSAVLYATARCCLLALSNNIVARSIDWFGRLGHRANGGCFNPTREFLADGSTEHWVIHLSVFPQRTMQYKILHLRKNHTKKEHILFKYIILWIIRKKIFTQT